MSLTAPQSTLLRTDRLSGRQRYHLLCSLVVPRPIGWISSRSRAGRRNLAPFSYFGALSATPMLVGVSIGHRKEVPKDSLLNLRETGAFCVNVVDKAHLEAMNLTSADYPHGEDEFEMAGLEPAEAEQVDAPFVRSAAAVFECTVSQEVELEGGRSSLVIGRVEAVRLGPGLSWDPERYLVDPHSLDPVGRLGGPYYSLQGEVISLLRPETPSE